MPRNILLLLILLFGLQQEAAAQQEPAGASSYLAGVFDLRDGRTTLLHIVNPTSNNLLLLVAFFDPAEQLQRCITRLVTPNGIIEINVLDELEQPPGPPLAEFGAVKIVALAANGIPPAEARPRIGIVGNQRLVIAEGLQPLTETGLHPIQTFFLENELPRLRAPCLG